jgi:hypothetical protein
MKVKYIQNYWLNEGVKMPVKINHTPIDNVSDNSKREITMTKKDILNISFNGIKELIYDAIDDVINADKSKCASTIGDEAIYFIFAKRAESYDQDGRVTIRNVMNSIDKKGEIIFVYMTFVSAYDDMQTIYLGDCALQFMQFIDKIHDAIVDVYPNARLKLYQEVMGSFDNLKIEYYSSSVRCIVGDVNDSLDLYHEHIAVHRNSSKSMFGFPKNDYMIKKYLEGNRTTNEIPMFIECCSGMTFSHLLKFMNNYGLSPVYCTDYHNPANYIQFTLNYNIYQMEKYVNLNDFLNEEFAVYYIGQISCAGVFVDLSKYSKDKCVYLHNKYRSYNISCLSTYSNEPYIWFYLGQVNKSTSKSYINRCSEKMGNILLPETIEKCLMNYDEYFRGFLYYPISNEIFLLDGAFSDRKNLSDELQHQK